ncbi:retinitis pigmentosa GTPase regulator b [Coregonus clupeaformis]|uniref:retinitis pigmentosa GTPase regulator b n=1 Tax=Coregonus clupeaformis TaxID=59861 RepID=UPI001E1C99AE|nr:retinitis pigmentosa GTPase regulator b [Coregonus clupeaformis]
MAGETEDEIPETGAVFTFGKSKFADNVPSKFWLKNDVPLNISCGDEHTALITENGKLFMFGSNNWGQLGLGSKTMVNKPTCVKALKSEKVRLAACGRNHTTVYTSRGNVYSTGGNNEGQLGLGDCEERTAFQLVDFFSSHGPIKMLAAGSNTSAALTESGKLFMWGDNTEGQIGLGKESSALTPQEVTVGRPVAWVSCGYYHSALVTVDGGLYTFGERDSGKLGLATGQLDGHRVPQLVKGITDRVTQVACGGGHTVAVTDEDLYTFGLGQFGQLGQGTCIFEARLPRAVDHFRKGRVRQVMCGENHTAVITDSGLLYTFGDGRHGKLGLGEENFTNQFKPTLCPRFLKYNVQAVTCGGCHMLVLAKPRNKSCQEVTLEEDDVTEDYLEKSYTELLGDTLNSTPATLNRSLSARVRRREKGAFPGAVWAHVPDPAPLTSGYLNTSTPLPVSSQTIPSSLPSKELTNRKVHNGVHQHRSTGSIKKEKRSEEKGRDEVEGSAVENMMDNESVKDLGDTTDFLNMTHVMKMDPSDKMLTLSPVQKRKGKLVKGYGKAGEQPELCTPRRVDPSPRRALPTELLRSSSDRSLVVEKRPRHRAAQGKGSGKENLIMALEEIKPAEPKAVPAQPSSIRDISKAKSKPCPSAQKSQPLAVERKVKKVRERFVVDSKAIQMKSATKGQSAEVKNTLLEVNPISTKVKSQHVAVKRTPARKSVTKSQGLKLTDALPVKNTTKPDVVSEVPQKTKNENTEREKGKPKTELPEQTPQCSLLTGMASLVSGVGLVAAARQLGSPSDSESVRSPSRAQRFSRQSAEDAQSSWSQSSKSMASEPGGKRTAVSINIIPAPGSSDQGAEEEECRSYSGPPDNGGQEERGDETGSNDDQTPAKQEEESEDDDTVKVEEEEEDGGISELEEESEGGDEQCETETDRGEESELEDAEKEESGLEEEEGDRMSSPVGGEGESVGEEEEEGEGESKASEVEEEEEGGEVSQSDTESKSKESDYEEEEEESEEEDESVGSVEESADEEYETEADSGTKAEEEDESSTAEDEKEEDKSEEEEAEEEAGEEEESEDEEEAEEESENKEEAEEESEDEEEAEEESEDEEEAGKEEKSEDEEEGEKEESEDEEEAEEESEDKEEAEEESEDEEEARKEEEITEDSGQPSPLAPTEEISASSTQPQNRTTEEKSKRQPGTNRKLSLFKRLSSSKAKQAEESVEAPAEGTGVGELPASAKGPSAGLKSRDPSETSASGAQPPLRAPLHPGGRGARSTTCTLL